MKKFCSMKIFLNALFFIIGLLSAVWIFMPWKQAGEAMLLSASERLPKPAAVAYSSVAAAGNGFAVNNLEIRNLMGMLNISFETLTVVPDITASLLGMAPTCRLAFTGASIGDIAVTPLRKLPGSALGSGQVTVSAGSQGVFLDGLRSEGELSVNGSLLIDTSALRIVWADAVLDVKSQAFEENLPVMVSVSGLPLQREGPGRWLLRRARGSE